MPPGVRPQSKSAVSPLDIKLAQCEALNDEFYKKCQMELDKSQNEVLRQLEEKLAKLESRTERINSKTDRIDSNLAGLSFLQAKIQVIHANASIVKDSVVGARNTFKTILEMKEPPSIFADLILAVAMSAVPALGATINPLREWRNSEELTKRFFAELHNRSGNINLDFVRKRLKEDEKQPVDAFEQALNAAQAELNRASKIQKDFLDKIKNKEITLSVDVEKLWNETGFGKYAEPITISYVEFEKFILYKAFQFYTETHCKVFIWGKGGYERVAENSGDFSGLSPASRKEIYKKFGKDWVASSDYPQINNISDLCRYWKPKIIRLAEVSDRPLSQRGGLF